MTAKMSQKEYLKKYLSGGSDKKKKKKSKNKATVKIIDDDVHGDNDLGIDEELLLTGEDAPQIVGIIDASETNTESKWKSISGIKQEDKPAIRNNEDDLWGKKATSHTSPDRWPPPETKRTALQSQTVKHSNGRSNTNADQSPPRKRPAAKVRRSSDQSPPRRRPQSRRDSDQSPPRKRSPRARKNSDQSPPRKRPTESHHRSGSRFSPSRIKRETSSDQSPPRRRNNGNPFKSSTSQRRDSDQSPPRIKRERNSSESPPPTHKPSASKMSSTLDGKRAGLQDAKTLKLETEERRRKEDKMFSEMSKEVSGRDAEVQVRQSSAYRRRRKDLDEDPEVQRKKAAHEQQKKELYDRWNKGLKQIEAHQAKASDDQYESSKPLARYSDDVDLDEMLKQKERDDDPMLEYMRSKKKEQQKAQNIPVMPKYKGSFPENRFGIPPGYRWDGVDRSNGYEQKWFDVQNKKKALADESYKYSTEDM